MTPSLRPSGLASLPDLPWGSHFCVFFQDANDLSELLIPYFVAGLRAGEAAVWVTSAPLSPDEATAALLQAHPEASLWLRSGQLQILDLHQFHSPAGRFDPLASLDSFEQSVERLLAAGYCGVRAAGMAWTDPSARDLLLRYELAIGEHLPALPVVGTCCYPLEGCSPDLMLDAIRTHDFALFRRGGRWEVAQNTSHQRLESECRRLATLLDTVIDQMPAGVAVADPAGELLMSNRQLETILRQPVAARTVADLSRTTIGLDGRPLGARHPLARSLAGEIVAEELTVARPDGSIATLDLTSNPVRDASGSLLGAVAVANDVTDRHRAENSLRASEQKYRLLFENMSSGFAYHRLVCDPHGQPVDFVFLEMNEVFAEQMGLRREASIGRRVTDVLPGIQQEDFDFIGNFGRVALSGVPFQCERYVANLERWIAITAYCPVPGDFAVITQDVTAAKRAQAEREALLTEVERARQFNAELAARELQRARELEAVVEATHAQLALLDPDFDFLIVNSSYAHGSGHSKEELIGRNHFDFFPNAENRAIFERARDRAERFCVTEKPFRFEDQPERGTTWWNWSLVPLTGPDGKTAALLLSLFDVTEVVLARQRAEQLYEDARNQADLRERLMAILGHDLRQPLNVITASSGALLRHGGLDERAQRSVERIERNARRIERMIRDLLDYTRSRAGTGIPIRPESADLQAITLRVVEEMQAAHPDRPLRLEVDGDCRGQWDAERLLQVLGNLLTNALQHGDPCEPIDVRVLGDADTVELEVHNRGEPIADAALPKLFEPFQQAAPGGRRSTGGLGLGLYIVREILTAHGGSIAVRSTSAEGTTFSARLPKRSGESPDSPVPGTDSLRSAALSLSR